MHSDWCHVILGAVCYLCLCAIWRCFAVMRWPKMDACCWPMTWAWGRQCRPSASLPTTGRSGRCWWCPRPPCDSHGPRYKTISVFLHSNHLCVSALKSSLCFCPQINSVFLLLDYSLSVLHMEGLDPICVSILSTLRTLELCSERPLTHSIVHYIMNPPFCSAVWILNCKCYSLYNNNIIIIKLYLYSTFHAKECSSKCFTANT